MRVTENQLEGSAEEIAEGLNGLLEQLKANVCSAAERGDSFDAVERSVLSSVLDWGIKQRGREVWSIKTQYLC